VPDTFFLAPDDVFASPSESTIAARNGQSMGQESSAAKDDSSGIGALQTLFGRHA